MNPFRALTRLLAVCDGAAGLLFFFPPLRTHHRPATTTQSLGQWGESFARRRLTRQGLTPYHHNWRSGRREIDLIMIDGRTLVFVEVKTRTHILEDVEDGDLLTDEQHARINQAMSSFITRNSLALKRRGISLFRLDLFIIKVQPSGSHSAYTCTIDRGRIETI